jgi:NADH-quinone oxidoreductase subunit N
MAEKYKICISKIVNWYDGSKFENFLIKLCIVDNRVEFSKPVEYAERPNMFSNIFREFDTYVKLDIFSKDSRYRKYYYNETVEIFDINNFINECFVFINIYFFIFEIVMLILSFVFIIWLFFYLHKYKKTYIILILSVLFSLIVILLMIVILYINQWGYELMLKSFNQIKLKDLNTSRMLEIFYLNILDGFNNGSILYNFFVYSNNFIINNFIMDLKILIIILGLICSFFIVIESKKIKINLIKYFIFFIPIILCNLILVSVYNLFIGFICIEIQNLCFVYLISIKKDSILMNQLNLRFFIINSFGSIFLFFGGMILYNYFLTFNLLEIKSVLLSLNLEVLEASQMTLLIGLFFIVTGLFFKIGVGPFGLWMSEVYENSPLITVIIFSIIPKIGYLSLLLNIYIATNCFIFYWKLIFVFFGLLSLIIGSFGALSQIRLKKLLAYSTINYFGYILLTFTGFNTISIIICCLYLFFYFLFSLNIWYIIMSLEKRLKRTLYIIDLAYLRRDKKLHFFSLICSLLYLSGLPPFILFSLKFISFNILSYDIIISYIFLICNVISIFYYLRLIKIIYIDNIKKLNETFIYKNTCDLLLVYYILILIYYGIFPFSFLYLNVELLTAQFGIFFNDICNNFLFFNRPKLNYVPDPTPLFIEPIKKKKFIKELLDIKNCGAEMYYTMNFGKINELCDRSLHRMPYYYYERNFLFTKLAPLSIDLTLEECTSKLYYQHLERYGQLSSIKDKKYILKTGDSIDLRLLLDILYAQYVLECHNINSTLLNKNPEYIRLYDKKYWLNLDIIFSEETSAGIILNELMPFNNDYQFRYVLEVFRDQTFTKCPFKEVIQIKHWNYLDIQPKKKIITSIQNFKQNIPILSDYEVKFNMLKYVDYFKN